MGQQWGSLGKAEDYLEWAFSNMVSSEATMEMLQPTREMYSRGVCSSVGTGSPESCYRAKGAESLKHRSVQLYLGSAREAAQTSAPSPFPTARPSPALTEAVACIMTFATYNSSPCSSLKALLSHSMYTVGESLLPLYGQVYQPWSVWGLPPAAHSH